MQGQDLPYEDIPRLMQTLQSTFSGDNDGVQRATAILQAMSANITRFVDALIRVIMIESLDDESLKAKNAASVALTRYLLDLMKKHQFETEQRNYTINAVIQAMFSNYVPLPMKTNLQYFLLLLYSVDIESHMIEKGFELIKEKLSGQDINEYPPAFLILQALVNTSPISQANVANWFEALKEPLINIGGGLAHGIVVDIQALGEDPQQTERLNHLHTGLKIFKMWGLTVNEFAKLLGQNNVKLSKSAKHLQVFVVSEQLAHVLQASLFLNIRSDKQIDECIFSTSGTQEIDQLLNNIKANILKIFNRILDVMSDLLAVVPPLENKFYMAAHQYGVPGLLKSLALFFRHENLNVEALLGERDLSELICESLGLLVRMASYQDLYPTYSLFIKHLLVDVCFSLLRVSSSELEVFKNNPEQFVALGNDTVGPQSSNTPKTQAAKFLVKLCSSIDGALSYVVKVALCMIDFCMVSDQREDIPNTHKDLEEHIDSIIISKTEAATRVETCLLVLTILNNPISKRKDLLPTLEKVLTTYSEFFLGEKSKPIIKARLCLLLASYASSIFKEENQKDAYILHLNFLLQCIGLEGPECETLVEQANASLYAMFEREFLTSRLGPYICDFLETLTKFVLFSKANKIFDTIHEIVTSYEAKIIVRKDVVINLMEALVKRWYAEFELTRKDPKSKKIILNKIWNVIRGIGGKEEYVIKYQEDIENTMFPMFQCLEINQNLDFDEDILNYIASVTKITKTVSPTIWKVFQMFPKIFERYQGMLSHLFPPLNQIIVYGQNIINQDPQAGQVLIDMGIQALAPAHKGADEANFSEGAVFLQLIIQYVNTLTNDQLQRILIESYKKYQGAEAAYLKARLGGVFLSAFMKCFDATQEILANLQILTPVMNIFLKDVVVFESSPYDRKILTLGLTSLLAQANLGNEILSRFEEIFDVLVSLLRYVRFIELRESKKGPMFYEDSEEEEEKKTSETFMMKFLDNKAQLDAEIDEEQLDDDSEEEEGEYIFGKQEANSVVRGLETSLKQMDEFLFFNEAVQVMKNIHPQLLAKLVETLPQKKREFLGDVLQSKRVDTEQEGKTEPRKIVKTRAMKIAQVDIVNGNFGNK